MPRLMLTCLVLGYAHTLTAAFLPGTEDIPLMDGLTVSEDGAFDFDTPGGQILNVTATGTKTPEQIQSFYAETLTALGWRETGRNGVTEYQRDGDILQVSITSEAGETTASFSLTFPGTR